MLPNVFEFRMAQTIGAEVVAEAATSEWGLNPHQIHGMILCVAASKVVLSGIYQLLVLCTDASKVPGLLRMLLPSLDMGIEVFRLIPAAAWRRSLLSAVFRRHARMQLSA